MDYRTRALQNWLTGLDRRSALTDPDRSTVLALPGRVVEFAANRDVVKLGETPGASTLVVEGVVARFGQTVDGVRQLTALYLPGDMADLHSAVLPKVSAPLQTANRAVVLQVPHDAIRAAAERSPRLALAFWQNCAIDAQIGSEWLLNLGRRNARGRVAHLLCELGCRYAQLGRERDRFPFEMTQAHFADATGLTSVHVNRTLRQLREDAVIEVRNQVALVHDWSKLCAIGDFDPGYLHIGRGAAPKLL